MIETIVPPGTQQEGFWLKWGGWLAGGFVVGMLVLVWAVLTFGVYSVPETPRTGENATFPTDAATAIAARGQFGDMFGFANALFSGLAFTALIVSLNMQRRELALQREELKLTRREMVLARDEAVKQAKALAAQARTMEDQARNELLASQINITTTLLQVCFDSLGKPIVESQVAAAIGGPPALLIPDYLAQLKRLQGEARKPRLKTGMWGE